MATSNSTCWLMIERAAAGQVAEREAFARHYTPLIRAYLGARWRGTPRMADLDDAVQEVFLECFRQGGILERSDRDRPGGFRAFLYGVTRNVARRVEDRAGRCREVCNVAGLDSIDAEETTLSRAFDRAWARTLLREAFALLEEEAARDGGLERRRRVELLERRFRDDLPVRDIAREWNTDSKALHRQLDRAKKEFQEALARVMAFHSPGTPAEIAERCRQVFCLVK